MTLFARLTLITVSTVLLAILALYAQVSYLSKQALEAETQRKLQAVLSGRASELNRYLDALHEDLQLATQNPAIKTALRQFSAAYGEFEQPQFTLQRDYITRNPHPKGEKHHLNAADNDHHYNRIHQRYHPMFTAILQTKALYDIFLVDNSGNVVYTVFKELDYATNLLSGPWKDSGLATVVTPLLHQPVPGSLSFEDFAPYKPSHGAPAGFIAMPVFDDNHGSIGVLVFQMPVSRLNALLQQQIGLGNSGETYLVSHHKLMLTNSRFSDKDTILQQKADTVPVRLALDNQSGLLKTKDYRGVAVVSAFTALQPFATNINGAVSWALLAEVDIEEMEQPALQLKQEMSLLGLLITFIAMLVGIIGARTISHPIAHIQKALTKLVDGDDVTIPGLKRNDEIGKMAKAAETFRQQAAQINRDNKTKAAIAELTRLLTSNITFEAAPDITIRYLCNTLCLPLGAFYLTDEAQQSSLVASFGADKRSQNEFTFDQDRGIVGQCVKEKRKISLDPVPAGFITIASGLGKGPAQVLNFYPVFHQDRCLAVVELGSTQPFSEAQLAVMDEIVDILGLQLSNLKAVQENAQLLAETRRQTAILARQQEELNQSNEELRTQTEELKASEEELRAQQDDINQKNQVLQQQSHTLIQSQQDTEVKANELAQASQYKSEFLANMSHELRTPLNSILILSKDLCDNEGRSNMSADQLESASVIYQSGSSLLQLINDILDLSKIEAGKFDILIEAFHFKALTDYIRRVFKPLAEEKQIDFDIVFKTEMPLLFYSDYHRFSQILTNLLSNAIKFTDQGKVSVEMFFADDKLQIDVIDSGIGIAEEKLEHIFGAFEQVDGTTSRKYGGTGLGLAITRKMAKLLNGELRVASEEGKGSCFTLIICDQKDKVTDSSGAAVAAVIDSPLPQRHGSGTVTTELQEMQSLPPIQDKGTLLLIEDDARLVRILERMLDSLGYPVQTAESGEAALKLIEQSPPQGIFLDMGLPGISGMEVLRQLKNNPKTKQLPVCIMSGTHDTGETRTLGALGFIQKPVTRDGIAKAIKIMAAANQQMPRVLLLVNEQTDPGALVKLFANDALDLVVCRSGADALKQLQQQQWHAIIMTMDLNDTDGLEWLERVKSQQLELPPVVVTAARNLSEDELLRWREYTDNVVVESPHAAGRLRDELLCLVEDHQAQIIKAEGTANGQHLLLVDDDTRNLYALSKVLRNKGYRVSLANSGQKALELLENNAFELLVSDIMMPEMDGYELIRNIRAQGLTDLPIIALTAKAMQGDKEKCFSAGASDYLSKPVDVDRLIELIQQWSPSP